MDDSQEYQGQGTATGFGDGLPAGTTLLHGQFTIDAFLNAGGFGVTYLARDSLDRTVVIKECFPSSMVCRNPDMSVSARSRSHQAEFEAVVRHFGQEARRLSKLQHPHIVGIHQVFEHNSTAYMALDFVSGRDLLDIIDDENHVLHPIEVKKILLKCLDAITYIHENDVLHRDISPDNILIDKRGNPVLIDFGAAREEATRASRALSALHVVKDGYSPHEFYLAGSSQDASSDLYSLGATFYHVICGEAPPDSQARVSAVAAGQEDPYEPVSGRIAGYDQFFLSAIDQALSIFPADRIQTAAEWSNLIDTDKRRNAALEQAQRDSDILQSIQKLVTETNKQVHADIQAKAKKALEDRKLAEQQQRLAQEEAKKRKRTLDELAALDDGVFMEEQKRLPPKPRNYIAEVVKEEPKPPRSILSRLLPIFFSRSGLREDSRSDYL